MPRKTVHWAGKSARISLLNQELIATDDVNHLKTLLEARDREIRHIQDGRNYWRQRSDRLQKQVEGKELKCEHLWDKIQVLKDKIRGDQRKQEHLKDDISRLRGELRTLLPKSRNRR